MACHKCKEYFKQNEEPRSKIILASTFTLLTKNSKVIKKKKLQSPDKILNHDQNQEMYMFLSSQRRNCLKVKKQTNKQKNKTE